MDKSQLTAKRLATDTHTISGVGEITFRALSRTEAMAFKDVEMDVETLERKLLAIAMVDPEMAESDVAAWQAASPAGELEEVVNRVAEMSGMTAQAAKAAVRKFRGKSG